MVVFVKFRERIVSFLFWIGLSNGVVRTVSLLQVWPDLVSRLSGVCLIGLKGLIGREY